MILKSYLSHRQFDFIFTGGRLTASIDYVSKKYQNASKSKRLKAFIWDVVLPILPMFILFLVYWVFQIIMVFFGVEQGDSVSGSIIQFLLVSAGLLSFIWIFAYWLISLWFIHKTGQTIGKRRVDIAIIDLKSNSKVGVIKYLLSRVGTAFVISLVSLIYPVLSVLELVNVGMVLFDKNNEALHDKLWKTRVVELNKQEM